jgi:hypothetical protein
MKVPMVCPRFFLITDLEKNGIIKKIRSKTDWPHTAHYFPGDFYAYYDIKSINIKSFNNNGVANKGYLKIYAGNYMIDKIIGWSEPAEMFGKKITEVKFSAKFDSNTGNEFSDVAKQDSKDTAVHSMKLYLSNTAWSAE